MMRKDRAPVRDGATGKPMKPREQPGYYPGFSTLKQKGYWDATTRQVVEKRVSENNPEHPKPLKFFTDVTDAATMEAVVDRILPQEDRTPERRIAILPGIDERLEKNKLDGFRYEDMPPDREAYKLAAKAFEQMAHETYGRPFAELRTLEQELLIKSIHDGKPAGAKELWKRMNVDRFWQMLVTDCVTEYYAHPWAWDEVGFGGPAYPRGYMRLEEGEPEPWEVNEKRYEWLAPEDSISDIEEEHGMGEEHQTHHGQGGTH